MAKTPKIIPVSDLRKKTSDVLKDLSGGDPVFITQRGRAAAVMVSMKAYENLQRELDILRLLARGEKEIENGAGDEFPAEA
jgi:prevent-host-death family protein